MRLGEEKKNKKEERKKQDENIMVCPLHRATIKSNISSTCLYNMVNFGPLAAEIDSLVWCTPGNFNGFCVLALLAALLHGI